MFGKKSKAPQAGTTGKTLTQAGIHARANGPCKRSNGRQFNCKDCKPRNGCPTLRTRNLRGK